MKGEGLVECFHHWTEINCKNIGMVSEHKVGFWTTHSVLFFVHKNIRSMVPDTLTGTSSLPLFCQGSSKFTSAGSLSLRIQGWDEVRTSWTQSTLLTSPSSSSGSRNPLCLQWPFQYFCNLSHCSGWNDWVIRLHSLPLWVELIVWNIYS